MKPKNFPARKTQRQIDAMKRADGNGHTPYTDSELSRIGVSRGTRTKKDRRGQ